MRRSLWSTLALAITMLAAMLGMASCEIHEFPEMGGTPTPVKLRLHFNTDLPVWNHFYELNKRSSISRDDIKFTHFNQIVTLGNMHYIVHATSADGRTANFDFTRNVSLGYDCDLPIELPAGQWNIRVWADLNNEIFTIPFYNSDDFDAIERQAPHVGNTDYADAFRGTLDVGVYQVKTETDLIAKSYTIEMERPLAKYEFVSNDLKEFMKTKAVNDIIWGIKGDDNAPTVKTPDFSRLKVRFFYPTYMPSVYSMSTDRPIDSSVGRYFNASITMINEEEASVGFDYVMVNGAEAAVTVQIGIYTPEGEQISITPPIDVPLLRSTHTIMRGKFLTINSSSGLSIDPTYDGDYNLWLTRKHDPPQRE